MTRASVNGVSLEAVLAPVTVDTFLERYWERRPLLLPRSNPALYAALPKRVDFEFMLSSLTAPQAGWFSLVKERARRPADSFLTSEGLLNLSEVYGAYREGHSLLLNQVQKRHRATGILCRAIELGLSARGVVLGRHIGANGYLSPPRSQGFAIHYDPHDVFILQLEGRKQWRLYGRHIAFPTMPPDQSIPAAVAGKPRRETVLSPGDFLYIPRGVLHDANTTDEASLHLTLSVEAVTWRDLFAEVMANDARFRLALPVGFLADAGSGRGRRRTLTRLTTALATSPAMKDAVGKIAGQLLANLDLLPNNGFGHVEDSASIAGDTCVCLGEGVLGRVELTRDAAVLHLPGATFRADRRMGSAFRYILRRRRFRARDLPVDAPGREKLRFVRELVSAGYLVRWGPRSTSPEDASGARNERS